MSNHHFPFSFCFRRSCKKLRLGRWLNSFCNHCYLWFQILEEQNIYQTLLFREKYNIFYRTGLKITEFEKNIKVLKSKVKNKRAKNEDLHELKQIQPGLWLSTKKLFARGKKSHLNHITTERLGLERTLHIV